MASRRRGEMPSGWAACLNAASACPFETPSGRPSKCSAIACTWTCAGVSRRHPGAMRAWSHLLRSLYQGPLRRKKLSLALPGAFSLAKLSGSPYLGVARPQIRISEKTPAPPGSRVFLLGLHGRLLSAGDRQSLPQKLVACKAMASSCGISPRYGADSCVANRGRGWVWSWSGSKLLSDSTPAGLFRFLGDLRNAPHSLPAETPETVTHPAETVTSARNRPIRVVRSWTRWRPVIRKRPGQAAAGHRSGCKRRSPGERHSPVDCVFCARRTWRRSEQWRVARRSGVMQPGEGSAGPALQVAQEAAERLPAGAPSKVADVPRLTAKSILAPYRGS